VAGSTFRSTEIPFGVRPVDAGSEHKWTCSIADKADLVFDLALWMSLFP
jgi:hypothetical protein